MSKRAELGVFLLGVPELERRVKLLDVNVQRSIRADVKRGTEAVTGGAYSRAPSKSGELRATIRSEFSKDGLTGWAKAGYGKLLRRSRRQKNSEASEQRYGKAKARNETRALQFRLANNSRQAMSVADLGVYAPVVEHGDRKRNKPKRAFMAPAFAAEVDGIQTSMQRSLQRSANQVAP